MMLISFLASPEKPRNSEVVSKTPIDTNCDFISENLASTGKARTSEVQGKKVIDKNLASTDIISDIQEDLKEQISFL